MSRIDVRRRVLTAHAVITAAAGLVLIARPDAIPAMVGIHLPTEDYLLAYLLAAAEFGFAVLSWLGARLKDADGLRAVIFACVAVHSVSAVLEAVAWLHLASFILVANVIARFLIVAVFLWLLPRSQTNGTSPTHAL
jgi:hypothetical protein